MTQLRLETHQARAADSTVPTIPESVDAIVVGAGPAGSVMAHQLATAGRSTILVDKAAFPRFKPCGCCLSSTALAALDAAGLADLPLRCGGVPATALDLAAGSRPSAHLPLQRSLVVERSRLDAALARAAEDAGATFIDGTSARLGPLADDHRQVMLQRAGQRFTVRAGLIIAADGLGGTLLRDERPFQPTVHPRSRIGAAVTLPADASSDYNPGVIWMTCGTGGYVGAVRLDDDRLHMAAAFDPAHMRSAGSPGRLAAHILSSAHRDQPVPLADAHWRGTPALSRTREVEGNRILIIGDAAAYVEPFTGEGIAWAVTSALAAMPIALAALRGQDTRGQWQRKHAACIRSRQHLCQILAWTLHRPRLTSCAVRLAAGAPVLSRPILSTLQRPLSLSRVGASA